MKSTAAIWGFGANTVVGRFQPSKNVISENNVNSKGFFVYMVKREQSYRKISEANVEFLSSLLEWVQNLIRIVKMVYTNESNYAFEGLTGYYIKSSNVHELTKQIYEMNEE